MFARTPLRAALAHPPSTHRKAAPAARRAVTVMAGPPKPSKPLGHVVKGDRGSSKIILDAWLDFACPFSGRFWRRCVSALEEYDDFEVCFVVYNQIQPWHAQSALAHETSLAVEALRGADGFVAFSRAAFDESNWEKFTDVWCENKTKGEIYDAYVDLAKTACGLTDQEASEVRDALRLDADALARGEKNPGNKATQNLKFYVKLARQTGVHVSPSTYLNGLAVDTASGWTREQWREFLDDALGK